MWAQSLPELANTKFSEKPFKDWCNLVLYAALEQPEDSGSAVAEAHTFTSQLQCYADHNEYGARQ